MTRVVISATGPQPSTEPTGFSPWLVAAVVVFLAAFALMGTSLPFLSKGFTWLNAAYLLLIVAALVLGGIGIVDRSRQEARRMRAATQPQPAATAAAGAELSHDWGRKIMLGTGALCLVVAAILTVISVLTGVPLGLYLMMVGASSVALANVGLLIYLCVVLPRMGWFALTGSAARRPDSEEDRSLPSSQVPNSEAITAPPDQFLPKENKQ